MSRLADVDAVCEFSYKAGYDQAVIDDRDKLQLALDVIAYLNKKVAELEGRDV
jgi:hypothetical protein